MAINFPATGGQATDGSFTYTVAGIVYAWNGSSWQAAGAGASATDRSLFSVTTNPANATPALSYNNNTGVFTYTPPLPESDTLSTVAARGKASYVLNGGYGTRQVAVVGSDVFSGNLTIFDNDTFFVGTNDRTLFGHRNGALTWCGDDGSGNTDWQNRKFELYHLDSSQNTNASYALAGALYLKSDDGYPISIGNDTGDIQLGNKSGSLKYLTASSTATKLFLNNVEKLSTTASGVTITGALTAGGLTYPTTNGNAGQSLVSDGAGNVTWVTSAGLAARGTVSSTSALANDGIANVSITTPKTFVLLKVETSHAAWVTLYTDTSSRTADASRQISVDPIPGSGVVAEVITTGAQTQLITPGAICFNSAAAGITYAKIVNKSGSTANVQVTLTYVALEA